MKSGSVPSLPGNTKSNRDHNSFRLFWIGDPDRMMRWGVRNWKKDLFLHTGIILILRVQMINYSNYFLNLLNLTCHVASSCLPQSFLMLLNQAWLALPCYFLQLLTRIWLNYCHENQLALYRCCIMDTMTLYVLVTNKHQPQTSSELVGSPGLMMGLSFHTCSGRFHPHKWLPHVFKNRAQFAHQELNKLTKATVNVNPPTCL